MAGAAAMMEGTSHRPKPAQAPLSARPCPQAGRRHQGIPAMDLKGIGVGAEGVGIPAGFQEDRALPEESLQ